MLTVVVSEAPFIPILASLSAADPIPMLAVSCVERFGQSVVRMFLGGHMLPRSPDAPSTGL